MCKKLCRSIIKKENDARSTKRKRVEKKVNIKEIILRTFKRNQIQVVLLGSNGELLGTGMGKLEYFNPMY